MGVANLKELIHQQSELGREIRLEAIRTYPQGRRVRFHKGNGMVEGVVLEPGYPRIKILSDSGKSYWVYLFWLLETGETL